MPYPMSHLYISENIINKINIDNIAQFYLGSMSPDAIHFRQNFDIVQKIHSHLYEDLNKDNLDFFFNNWMENVLNFFNKNKKTRIDKNFLIGYCMHLLADIYNYKFIWIPFKNEYGRENEKIYQNECKIVDLELFQKLNYEVKLFPIIKDSKGINFFGLISENEVNELKNNVLNIQYKNKQDIDSVENSFMTYDKMQKFNNDIINFIVENLYKLKI